MVASGKGSKSIFNYYTVNNKLTKRISLTSSAQCIDCVVGCAIITIVNTKKVLWKNLEEIIKSLGILSQCLQIILGLRT